MKIELDNNLKLEDIIKVLEALEKEEEINLINEDFIIEVEKSYLYTALLYKSKKNYNVYFKKYLSIEVNKTKDKVEDNYLLPVGTVVNIKGNDMIILSRALEIENNYVDYLGALYPEGLIKENLFEVSHKDIEKILYLGFDNEESINSTIAIKKLLDSK